MHTDASALCMQCILLFILPSDMGNSDFLTYFLLVFIFNFIIPFAVADEPRFSRHIYVRNVSKELRRTGACKKSLSFSRGRSAHTLPAPHDTFTATADVRLPYGKTGRALMTILAVCCTVAGCGADARRGYTGRRQKRIGEIS